MYYNNCLLIWCKGAGNRSCIFVLLGDFELGGWYSFVLTYMKHPVLKTKFRNPKFPSKIYCYPCKSSRVNIEDDTLKAIFGKMWENDI